MELAGNWCHSAQTLEPNSKDNYRARRLIANWIDARTTKVSSVVTRFSQSLASLRLRPHHENDLSTSQRRGSRTKPLHVVAAFDDFDAQRRNFSDDGVDLTGVVAAVGPNMFEPGKAVADLALHERRAISVLHAGGVDVDAQRQTLRIDQRANFVTLHLFTGVIAGQAVMTAPFSADFSDRLSMIAAVGLASRSISSRIAMRILSQIAS